MEKFIRGLLGLIGRIIVILLWGIFRLTEVITGQIAKWLGGIIK
jgi:hypothetical protein